MLKEEKKKKKKLWDLLNKDKLRVFIFLFDQRGDFEWNCINSKKIVVFFFYINLSVVIYGCTGSMLLISSRSMRITLGTKQPCTTGLVVVHIDLLQLKIQGPCHPCWCHVRCRCPPRTSCWFWLPNWTPFLFIYFFLFFFYRAKLDSLNAKDLSRSVFLKKIKFWGRFFLGFGIWNWIKVMRNKMGVCINMKRERERERERWGISQ